MIKSFRHKGLKKYFDKADRSKLPQNHFPRIKRVLYYLNDASQAEDMNLPGYNFHSLSGDLAGFYSVKVSANYRILFRFENENAFDVDLIDYH